MTGEYADYSEWNVHVFLTRKAANAYKAKLIKWAKDNGVWNTGKRDDQIRFFRNTALYQKKCPLDPEMTIDYTGVDWKVESCGFEQ